MSESASERYATLTSSRESYILRGRKASALTIPSILPPSRSKSVRLVTPYQSVGARGVNHLASKLLLTLMPADSPMFRMQVDSFTLRKMSENPDTKTRIEKALGQIERETMAEIAVSGDRVPVFEALLHLIVVGNVLLFAGRNGLRMFHLDRYVVKRDPEGSVVEIITEEEVYPDDLPKAIREDVTKAVKSRNPNEKTCKLYTRVYLDGAVYRVYQEAEGQIVPGSKAHYPKDKSPWIALRFTRVDGEDYGRGLVEQYYGDLVSLEELTRAIVQGATAASKVLFLVDPNGSTKQTTISRSPNGAVRAGNAKDVTVLQLEKMADFKTAENIMQRIEQRLSYAFMLNSSVQRQGERVTAEEIRYVAAELEDALGGLYSILSQEFQLPYVRRKLVIMQRKGAIPPLPKDIVQPMIVTGIEALGRTEDLKKLDGLMQRLESAFGPQAVAQYVDINNYASRVATSEGMDIDGLLKDSATVQQEQQQQSLARAAESAAPQVAKSIGDAVNQGHAAQAQSQ